VDSVNRSRNWLRSWPASALVLQGPAVGEILRDLLLRRDPFVDIAPLSAERFEGAKLRPEYNIV
jgi:glycine/D-amino acid oxidase-like deaminating enzyme